MNALIALLHEPAVQRFGWVLIHFLWQGAAIGLAMAVVLRVLGRASARLRYTVLCAGLLACGAAPVVTWAVLSRHAVASPKEASPAVESGAGNFSLPPQPSGGVDLHSERAAIAPLPLTAAVNADALVSRTKARISWRIGTLEMLDRISPYAVACWLAGVIALSLRLVFAWTQLQRLRGSGTAIADSGWEEKLRLLAKRIGVNKAVRLFNSARVEVPTLIGWLRPVILLPASAFTGLTPAQLEAILAHELAHVRRYDYLVNLFQTAIETILFYHPAVWWISRKLREERENCCDDIAVETTRDRAIYASALAALEEGRAFPSPLAMAASGGTLVGRIRRIAGVDCGKSSLAPVVAAVLIVGCLLAPLGGRLASGQDSSPAPKKTGIPRSASRENPFVNSLGMQFVPVPETKALFSIWDTRVRDYLAYAEANPGVDASWKKPGVKEGEEFKQEENHPVINVSWDDATAFCTWLTQKERKEGKIGQDWGYRLPTNNEWSAGAAKTKYPWGDQFGPPEGAGNFSPIGLYRQGDYAYTSPVEAFRPNQYGLYDMGGNVGQWCEDWYRSEMNGKAWLEKHPFLKEDGGGRKYRVVRWAFWNYTEPQEYMLTANCNYDLPGSRHGYVGFRCVLASDIQTGEYIPATHQSQTEKPIVDAVKKNDVAGLEKLLAQNGIEVNKIEVEGVPVLFYAGSPEVAELLIMHGAVFDAKQEGPVMLWRAAASNNAPLVKWLLEHGVDANTPEAVPGGNPGKPTMMTPLEARIRMVSFRYNIGGHGYDVIKLLLQHGAKGENAMIISLHQGYTDDVKALWEGGVRNISELCYTVSQNAPVAALQKLLDQGMTVNPPGDAVITPLTEATQREKLDVIKFLVEHGADVNKGGTSDSRYPGWTPLVEACSTGHWEIVDYLLKHGALPDFYALYIAVSNNYTPFPENNRDFERTVKSLVDAGALKNVTKEQAGRILVADIERKTDISYPLRVPPEDTAILRMLLDAGLSPEVPMPDQKEKPDSVVGHYRDYYDKREGAYYEDRAARLKPLLDLLEKTDVGKALTPGGDGDVKPAGDKSGDPIPASSIKWTGEFGSSEADHETVYSLMARPMASTHTSPEITDAIAHWLKDHPKAVIVPVTIIGQSADKDRKGKEVYVWIIDGDQNLNLELVAEGYLEAETETIVKTPAEYEKFVPKQPELAEMDAEFTGEHEKLVAPEADYDAFAKKATDAGKRAKELKLGIWKPAEKASGPAVSERDFENAAISGDLEKVRAMLGEKPDLVSGKQGGSAALGLAAANGHQNVVELLLASKADVNAADNLGQTPLHLAALYGRKEIAELLIANKADVNAIDKLGQTPMHQAATNGHKELIELLLDSKADINVKDKGGSTPLDIAITNNHKDAANLFLAKSGEENILVAVSLGDLEKVKALLKDHPDLVSSKNGAGETPLHLAAGSGSKEMAQLLIANKADVNATDKGGQTPLFYAMDKDHKDIVQLLLANKADVNVKARNGTLLNLAAMRGDKEVMELLLAQKADVDARDSEGKTPLFLAVSGGHKEAVELLLANKADVNARDADFDQTPLFVAGTGDIAKLLLDAGAKVDIKDWQGDTPLHVAASGRKDVAELLLASGANVNAWDDEGVTPLHEAAQEGNMNLAKLLLAHKAAIDAKDRWGNTPLHYAAYDGRKDVAELLLASGADVNARTRLGETPLKRAVSSTRDEEGSDSDLEIVKLLLAGKADVNAKDDHGRTPLHETAQTGETKAAELLLANSADVNARDNDGLTPLDVANEDGQKNAAELLRQHGALPHNSAAPAPAPPQGAIKADLTRALGAAAKKGDAATAEQLLEAGADPNAVAQGFDGNALYLAASNNHADVIAALLKHGANPNSNWPHQQISLCSVMVNDGRTDIARLLHDSGAKISPAVLAGMNGDIPALKALAKADAFKNGTDEAMGPAVTAGQLDAVKYLKSLGGKIKGYLASAAIAGRIEMMQYLFSEGGIDVDAQNIAVTEAVRHDQPEALKLLLARGGRPYRIRMDSMIIIGNIFCSAKSSAVVKLLLEAGIDPNLDAAPGMALACAPDAESVHLLAQHGAKMGDRRTIIGAAINHGCGVDVIEALIKGGAEFDPDGNGVAALCAAAAENNVELTTALLGHGVNPNGFRTDQWNGGSTPLGAAVRYNATDAVRLLLARGANPSGDPRELCSPVDWAVKNNRPDIAGMLRNAGAKLDAVGAVEKTVEESASKTAGAKIPSVSNPAPKPAAPPQGAAKADLTEASMAAVKPGDAAETERLLQQGADPNGKELISGDYKDALFLAATGNHADVARLLLKYGADPGRKDDTPGNRLIDHVIFAGNIDMARILHDAGASISPQAWAAATGDIPALKLLAKKGAFKQGVVESMPYAVEAGQIEAVRFLEGVSSKQAATHYLWAAAPSGNIKMMDYLFSEGADIKEDGSNALCDALAYNRLETVNYLLKRGVDPNYNHYNISSGSQNIFSYVKSVEAVKLLLDAGANPNLYANAAEVLLRAPDAESVRLLVQHGVNPRTTFSNDNDLVSAAYIQGGVIDEIIRQGAQFDPKGNGVSILLYAPMPKNMEVARVLLDHGVDPNCFQSSSWYGGSTPLGKAAEGNATEIVRLLLARGANPSGDPRELCSPLSWAISNGRREIVEMLRKAGAHDVCDLSSAAADGDEAKAGELIKGGADVNEPDRAGRTPLSYAVRCSQPGTAKLLLQNGSNVNWFDSRGETPWVQYALLQANRGATARNDWHPPVEETTRSLAAMNELFAKYPHDPNYKDAAGRTALQQAILTGNALAVERLVGGKEGHRADPNLRDPDGRPPILLAALSPRARDTYSAGYVFPDDYRISRLRATAWNAEAGIAMQLIKAGAKLDLVVVDGKTAGGLALEAAAKANNPQLISVLKNAGAQ